MNDAPSRAPEVPQAVAAQRIAAGQDELPLEVAVTQEPMALKITSSRMGRLLDAVAAVYRQLGFDQACGEDVVFEQLVTARIIEPTSKQDAARVLAEAGVRGLVVSDGEAAAARLCEAGVAGPAVRGVRGYRSARPIGVDLV